MLDKVQPILLILVLILKKMWSCRSVYGEKRGCQTLYRLLPWQKVTLEDLQGQTSDWKFICQSQLWHALENNLKYDRILPFPSNIVECRIENSADSLQFHRKVDSWWIWNHRRKDSEDNLSKQSIRKWEDSNCSDERHKQIKFLKYSAISGRGAWVYSDWWWTSNDKN